MADEKDTYGTEFPRNKPLYTAPRPFQITPNMHFGYTNLDGKTGEISEADDVLDKRGYKDIRFAIKRNLNPDGTKYEPKYLIPVKDHFTQDLNVNTYTGKDYKVPETVDSSTIDPSSPFYTGGKNQKQAKVFSAATTIINQEKDPDKEKVMLYGLEDMEYKRVNDNAVERSIYSYDATTGKMPPPTSPLHPFVRMADPRAAQSIVNHSYNRYQYPISDIEHRKAFRNVFFTRPECYIMCNDGVLAQQCENDADIATSFMRMPHICKMLSPVYVTHTFGTNNDDDNINYLLSNRITGLSTEAIALSTNDTGTKSIEGFSVVTGMHMDSNQGGTLTVTFRDTKYLEVFEYFRVWMLYIYKRKKGVFEPPFSEYSYYNDFPSDFGKLSPKKCAFYLHPYDRAIEYTCSMFDFVTNEANDRILYWTKYYGLYPTNISLSGLSNEANAAITNPMDVEVTFRYQYKTVNLMKSLIEFNFNAGITDYMGRSKSGISLDNSSGYINDPRFTKITMDDNGKPKTSYSPYFGAGAMFTGTPYIVMGRTSRAPDKDGKGQLTVSPFIRFMSVNSDMINRVGNLGIVKPQSTDATGNGGIRPITILE